MLVHLSTFLPLRGNHFMIWFREIRNDIISLTNNEQIRVAPGESTSNPKAGRALGSASSISTGFGLPGHHIWGRALAGQGWTNRETMSPLVRVGLKQTCRELTDRYKQGWQMVNQLGPPLELFEARKVRQGDPIESHTRLGTLIKKPIPGTRGLGDSNGTKRRGGIA